MEKESDPRLYEISYLVKADDDQSAAVEVAAVSGAIEKEHGIVTSQNSPARKALSYPVDGAKDCWWGWIKFMAKPEVLSAIERELKEIKQIFRFSVFKINKADMAERPARKRRVVPVPPAEKTDIAEIDKKLEEMLGN